MEKSVFTVRQINSYIKSVLEEDLVLNFISVLGEISNFKNHPSGHLYFTVKDEYAALRCVMFKSAAYGLTFRPENGMKVIITGRVSVYDKTGDVQLYADAMQKAGTGNLFLEFEKLKQKLLAEGLFDDSRKKPIPEYVGCVAVITSKSGAAVRDIIQIIRRRNRLIKITVVPVLVQGEGAAAQIARAIDLVNEWGKADCIIVGRGGGSFEDLQAFNEEITALAIAKSKIPVISAVGHETDFTIADFAADKRAPTPSAAAELVSFDLAQTKAYVNSCLQEARRITIQRVENGKQRLVLLKNRRVFKNPAEGIYDRQIYIHTLLKRAQTVLYARISENRARIKYCAGAAENLSPQKTLLRGYAIITGEEGKAVVSIADLPPKIKVKMHDGEAKAQVTQIL